jgi:acyl-CoA synthetase (NDP forming)
MMHGNIDRLFDPRSVAIIGASHDSSRLSGRPLRYLRDAGYGGEVYPINPTRSAVQGLKSYARVGDTPRPPDVAIIAVASKFVINAIEQCAQAGVGGVVMFSSGFAESGAEGVAAQQRIAEICRASGMRLLGPNCLGLFNSRSRFFGTIATSLERGFPKPGNLAIVSQSGAYGQHLSYLLDRRSVGVSYMLTTGNEADVTISDGIAWAAGRDDVRVIAAYAESIRDGAAFVDALMAARQAGKQVVFVKVGTSTIGSSAVNSHTAGLAGDDAVFDNILAQFGVQRARSMEEQIDLAYYCSMGSLPKGDRLGIVTLSGGFGIHLADLAEGFGLAVPAVSASLREELLAVMPYTSTFNPVDFTGQAVNEPEALSRGLRVMLRSGQFDSLVGYFGTVGLGGATTGAGLTKALLEAATEANDTSIVLCMESEPDQRAALEGAGILVFEDPARAMAAIAAGALIRCRAEARQAQPARTRPALPDIPRRAMSEHEANRILSGLGFSVLPQRLVRDEAECIAAADQISYPIVLKLCSADLRHKSEIGGVVLDIRNQAALQRAYRSLAEQGRSVLGERLDGILVMPMAKPGVETIVGLIRDSIFGPIVMFGLGGIFVEVLRDVSFRRAPFDAEEAHQMIRQIKGYRILEGVRGKGPCDVDALAAALSELSLAAAAGLAVESLEINPLVVYERGAGVAVLDALIIPLAVRESSNDREARH